MTKTKYVLKQEPQPGAVSRLVAGHEKFLVMILGAFQTLLASNTFGFGPDINQPLIALIVPIQTWLAADTKT
jgi:hypothetical protein